MKPLLLDGVIKALIDSGFNVSDCRGARSCFDIIAKKDDDILLIKVLTNVEGLNSKSAHELKRVAGLISAKPLVVGDRLKSSFLSDGVIYERYGVHVINLNTFVDVLSDVFPFAHAVRGNYLTNVRPGLFRGLRGRLNMTQREFAGYLGVSAQSVYRYESCGSVPCRVMEKLLNLFADDNVVSFEKVFDVVSSETSSGSFEGYSSELKKTVVREFRSIGFKASITNAPFDVVAREDETVFTLVSNDWRRIERKASMVESISEMVGGYGMCVTERHFDVDVPVMSPEDLNEIKRPRDLIRMLSEF